MDTPRDVSIDQKANFINSLVLSSNLKMEIVTNPVVDVRHCINSLTPYEALAKGPTNWFVFPTAVLSAAQRGHLETLDSRTAFPWQRPQPCDYFWRTCSSASAATMMYCLHHTFVYFGSHVTYPLLTPLTSLTISSKPSKSKAVTASKPTSKRTAAHSKNA